MDLKIMPLTDGQKAELADMQAEIMRMFTANPRRPGAILAQIIPPAGVMRVRILGHDTVSRLAETFPSEWGDEKIDYRCPYCFSPLVDADVTRDGDALRCPDCAQRVEYFDAMEAYEESVSHPTSGGAPSAPPPAGPSKPVAEPSRNLMLMVVLANTFRGTILTQHQL